MATFSDSFNRTGTTLGSPWAENPTGWQTDGASATFAGADDSYAVVDAGASTDLEVSAIIQTVGVTDAYPGIVLSYTDKSNLIWFENDPGGGGRFFSKVAGTRTQHHSSSGWTSTQKVTLRREGNNLSVYRDGVQVGTTVNVASLPTGTFSGLRYGRGGATIPTQKWDDFSVATASSTITPATVATTSSFGTPTIQTGLNAPAATFTVSGDTVVVAWDAVSGATEYEIVWEFVPPASPAPPVLPTTTSFGTPSISAGAQVQPPSLATSTTTSSPAIQTGVIVPAPVLSTAVSLHVPTITANSAQVVAPATHATASTLTTPSITTGSVVAPAVLSTASSFPSVSIQASASGVAPAPAIVTTTGFAGTSASAGSSVSTATLVTATTVAAPAITTSTNVRPLVVATSTTFGDADTSTSVTVTVSTIQTASVANTPEVRIHVAPVAGVATTSVAFGTPSISSTSIATPGAIETLTVVSVPVIHIGFNAAFNVSTLITTSTVNPPTIQTFISSLSIAAFYSRVVNVYPREVIDVAIESPIDADDNWFAGEDKDLKFYLPGTQDASLWQCEFRLYKRSSNLLVLTKTTAAAQITAPLGSPIVVAIQNIDTATLGGIYTYVLRRTDTANDGVLAFGPASIRKEA